MMTMVRESRMSSYSLHVRKVLFLFLFMFFLFTTSYGGILRKKSKKRKSTSSGEIITVWLEVMQGQSAVSTRCTSDYHKTWKPNVVVGGMTQTWSFPKTQDAQFLICDLCSSDHSKGSFFYGRVLLYSGSVVVKFCEP